MRRLALLLVMTISGLLLVAGSAAAQPPGVCAVPPEPDRPGSGLVGLLDPAAPGTGAPGSVYAEVGYAGTTWRTYDLCSRPDVASSAGADTWVGNQLFNVAKTLVAAANGLHYQLAGGGQLDGVDELLHDGVGAMYRAVFTTWLGPALLVLAVILLLLAARGDLAQQTQRVLVALAALMLGSAVYAAPVSLLKSADVILLDGIAEMQEGFLRDVGAGDQDTLPATLADQIVYRTWLAGQFGSADTPQARDLGRDLLRAQTYTREEIAAGQDTPDVAAAKKQTFGDLTTRMGDRYTHFQGTAGSRVGAGGTALFQALVYAAFPAAAKLIVFIALIVLRMLVLFAPLIAVVAILRPQILAGLFRVAAGVTVNAVLAAALAAVHAWLVVAMLRPDSGVSTLVALIVAGVVSTLFWVLIRPVRRVLTIGSMVLPRNPHDRSAPVHNSPAPLAALAEQRRPILAPPAQRASFRQRVAPAGLARPALTAAAPPRPADRGARSTSSAPRPEPAPERSQGVDLEQTDPQLFTSRADRPLAAAIPAARSNGHRLGSGGTGDLYLGDWITRS